MEYSQEYQAYMREIERYLEQVKQGRRVAGYDPMGKRFSSGMEDQRQAKALGVPYQEDPRLKQVPTFDTHLPTREEAKYQGWKQRYAPQDSGLDYDLRGAFKAGLQPDATTGHWPDTFKKPNHPTFSDQSKYAPFGNPGSWQGGGGTFTPGAPQPTTGQSPQYGFNQGQGETPAQGQQEDSWLQRLQAYLSKGNR